MKRVGGLFERIASRTVLSEAFRLTAQGRRDDLRVRAFAGELDVRLRSIAHRVLDGSYAFGPYHPFHVRDGKSRRIHAPPFEQRVVHRAIVLVIGPALERGAVPQSFAGRRGLGHAAALTHAERQVRRHPFFLHADVEKYYDSIPHAALRHALGRRLRERRLLALLERLIESFWVTPGRGLPMGALTSQLFGNFLLDPVDHWALERFGIGSYARYMDDLGAWGDRPRLVAFRDALSERFAELGLTLKRGGQINRCVNGMSFLGFTLRPGRTRLSPRGRHRLRAKLSALHRGFRRGEFAERELVGRGRALFAWATRADDVRWRRAMLAQHFDHGDALELAADDARRQRDEHAGGVPVRLPQQEAARA